MSSLWIDDCPQGSHGPRIMLATPAYENPDASYTFSIQNSRQALLEKGIASSYLLLAGNCHVDDSRNTIVREFLISDCTDLVFLDADVSWDAKTLVRLCEYEIGEYDIVGGVYPFRRNGCADIPVMPLTHDNQPLSEATGGLVEVAGLPTGFMRIRRPVLDRMAAKAETFRNKAGQTIPLIFERSIRDGVRYGGDIGFCLKAREQGGRVYAAAELRLGHVTKTIRWGSYASAKRAQSGVTLRYATHRIRHGGFSPEVLQEVVQTDGNPWGAPEEVLAVAIGLARQADGPILELGSGLSTVLMAAATEHRVHAFEHSMAHAHRTQAMADGAGIGNMDLYVHPLVDGFYVVPENLPVDFSFLFVDGPPRGLGNRLLFAERLVGHLPDTIVFDDADSHGFKMWAADWAAKTGRKIINLPSERTMLMMRDVA